MLLCRPGETEEEEEEQRIPHDRSKQAETWQEPTWTQSNSHMTHSLVTSTTDFHPVTSCSPHQRLWADDGSKVWDVIRFYSSRVHQEVHFTSRKSYTHTNTHTQTHTHTHNRWLWPAPSLTHDQRCTVRLRNGRHIMTPLGGKWRNPPPHPPSNVTSETEWRSRSSGAATCWTPGCSEGTLRGRQLFGIQGFNETAAKTQGFFTMFVGLTTNSVSLWKESVPQRSKFHPLPQQLFRMVRGLGGYDQSEHRLNKREEDILDWSVN